MLKNFTTQFRDLGKETSIRFDFSFIDFQNTFLVKDYYSFSDLFEIKENNRKDISEIKDDFYYSEIGNVNKLGEVDPVKLNFDEKSEEYLDYFKKIERGDIIEVGEGEILISKVRPNLKKYVFIDDKNKEYFYTSAFIHLKPKKLNKVLYYSLRSLFFDNLIAISRQGKGYPTLKNEDLYYLKFNKEMIDKLESKEKDINSKIIPNENKIKELKDKIEKPQDIINEVFANEFSFDLKKFEELKKENIFSVNFSDFSNYHSLRFDFKNKKFFPIFEDIISKLDTIRLKNIVLEDPLYGANEPAIDGVVGNDIRYVRITDIDDLGELTNNEWKTAENIDEVYLLKDLDFLFARSGNTVGKSFLYNSNKHEKSIFAGYFIKFKIDFKNLNQLFFLYYSKSFIFELWKNGIVRVKGQPNINANEYLELQIPNIPLSKQKEIVKKIKSRLDRQEEIKKEIEKERDKIDKIIENAIIQTLEGYKPLL